MQTIELNRSNKSVPWGFSIQGGKEFGCPLSVSRITKESIADRFGMEVQDLIVKINNELTSNMTHQQAILAIQNLTVFLEIRKPNSVESSAENLNVNSTNSSKIVIPDLPLPPPTKMSNNSSPNVSSINIKNLPPPPDFVYSNAVVKESPLPVQSKTFNSLQATIDANNVQPSNNVKPLISSSQPRQSIPNVSITSKFQNVTLDPKNVEEFNRRTSEVQPKIPNSSVGLSKFLQDRQNYQSPNANAPTPRETLNLIGADTNVYTSGSNTNKTSPRQMPANDEPICCICKDRVRGAFIEANNRIYCKQHFICNFCRQPIESQQFIETKEGKLYCIEDFTKHVAPSCTACRQPVIQHQVCALGKTWHPGCFQCDHCHKPIPHGSFHTREQGDTVKIYCEQDYQNHFQIKCAACKFAIEGDDKYIQVAGLPYHTECYKR